MAKQLHFSMVSGGAAIAVAALLFHAPATAAPAAEPNAVLGLVTQFEEPLAGMEVDLTVRGHLLAATTTDPLGRFAIEGVAPGLYEIMTRGVVHDIIRVGPPTPVVVQPAPSRPTIVRVHVPGP